MKIAFLSSVKGNKGPSNVHRELVNHWPEGDRLLLAAQKPKSIKIIDSIIKGLSSDIVFSGDADWPELIACKVIHAFGKPIVCFNHGYVPYENEVNNLGLSRRKMNRYRSYLSDAAAIVANSKYQMKFVADQQPELTSKLLYINNAVNPFEQMKHHTNQEGVIRIAVSGGTRPIKGNGAVAQATKLLNDRGCKATLAVYGRDYAEDPELSLLSNLPYIEARGQVSHDQFLRDLQSIDVFVMNSKHEPFGLSVLDAIHAGASVLLSEQCGVLGVIDATEMDLIVDSGNPKEIAEKIVRISNRPNSSRLYQSMRFSELNWDTSSCRLRNIMKSILDN